ncbi:MAG: hypothetical protein ACFE9S_04700 [Candidatus Hermodarchaeota archaeon]
MNTNKILKILLILGGIVEIAIGLLFFLLDLFFEQLGVQNIPIFTQMAGTFIFCYGILLIYSARDIKKYLIIPILNILIRIVMVIFSLINIIEYPQFFLILLLAIPYDIVWSILMVIFLKKEGIIFKNFQINIGGK